MAAGAVGSREPVGAGAVALAPAADVRADGRHPPDGLVTRHDRRRRASRSPSQSWRSVRQTAQAVTAITISPWPGTGSARSSASRGAVAAGPGRRSTIASIEPASRPPPILGRVSDASDVARPAIALRPAPAAPAGSSDPTRRWALDFPDGSTRFPGIARTEAETAIPELERMDPADWDGALVEVSLPVLLSEGAGLISSTPPGASRSRSARTRRSPSSSSRWERRGPAHRLGLVRRVAGRIWSWTVDARSCRGSGSSSSTGSTAADADVALRWQDEARRAGG